MEFKSLKNIESSFRQIRLFGIDDDVEEGTVDLQTGENIPVFSVVMDDGQPAPSFESYWSIFS